MREIKHKIYACVKIILLLFFGTILTMLFLMNCAKDNFFNISLYELLSMCLIVIVSYILVEKNQDERILKSKLDQTLEVINLELDLIIKSLSSQNFSSQEYTLRSRKIRNKICILEKYSKTYSYSNDIQYIKDKFNTIDSVIGNHITNLNELYSISSDIMRMIDQINTRLDKIFMNLF